MVTDRKGFIDMLREAGLSKKQAKREWLRFIKHSKEVEMDDYTCPYCDHSLVNWLPDEDEEPDCPFCWDTGTLLDDEEIDRRTAALAQMEN